MPRPAICLGCGCTCDDIEVVVRSGAIVETRHACAMGAAWFGDGVAPARVLVDGREASLDEAVAAADALLREVARPLVYLSADVPCEAYREAVGLADTLRGAVDGLQSRALPAMLAAQARGRASATLGEIRSRADVVVFWGVDPDEHYPRFRERYVPGWQGVHGPGRGPRTMVAVDVGEHRGPADADYRIGISAPAETTTLMALAARLSDPAAAARDAAEEGPAVAGTAVTATATTATATDDSSAAAAAESGHHALASGEVERLAGWLASGRYVVVVTEAEDRPGRNPARHQALVALGQALNASTRGALSLLRAGGNASGAEAVLTWQSGYPAAVDFSRGFPRYRPYDGTLAARLDGGDVDALVLVGAADRLPADLSGPLARVPCIAIGPRASAGALASARVVIDAGIAGIHDEGLAVRMDDVPLPLPHLLHGPPPAAAVLRALRARLAFPDSHDVVR